jgi:hypothetical protein
MFFHRHEIGKPYEPNKPDCIRIILHEKRGQAIKTKKSGEAKPPVPSKLFSRRHFILIDYPSNSTSVHMTRASHMRIGSHALFIRLFELRNFDAHAIVSLA